MRTFYSYLAAFTPLFNVVGFHVMTAVWIHLNDHVRNSISIRSTSRIYHDPVICHSTRRYKLETSRKVCMGSWAQQETIYSKLVCQDLGSAAVRWENVFEFTRSIRYAIFTSGPHNLGVFSPVFSRVKLELSMLHLVAHSVQLTVLQVQCIYLQVLARWHLGF